MIFHLLLYPFTAIADYNVLVAFVHAMTSEVVYLSVRSSDSIRICRVDARSIVYADEDISDAELVCALILGQSAIKEHFFVLKHLVNYNV